MDESRICSNCEFATFDTKFENLNLNGEPTLVRCKYEEYARIVSEPACYHYQPKTKAKN